MAFYNKGPFDQFNGVLGRLVGAKYKGKSVLRTRPNRTKRPLNAKQEAAKARFELVRNFCNALSDVFQFTMSTPQQTGLHVGAKLVSANAVTGVYPTLAINYSKVDVTQGKAVAKALNPSVTSAVARQVKFQWEFDSLNKKGQSDDKAILVIYCEELGEAESILEGPERHSLEATVTAYEMSGKVVHAWIAFRSAEGETSGSIYLGSVTVA